MSCESGLIYTTEPLPHSCVSMLVGLEISHGNKPSRYNTQCSCFCCLCFCLRTDGLSASFLLVINKGFILINCRFFRFWATRWLLSEIEECCKTLEVSCGTSTLCSGNLIYCLTRTVNLTRMKANRFVCSYKLRPHQIHLGCCNTKVSSGRYPVLQHFRMLQLCSLSLDGDL